MVTPCVGIGKMKDGSYGKLRRMTSAATV